MADVELLPLPSSPLVQMSWDGPGAEVRHTTVYTADQMHAHSRACVEANLAPLQAENERLRAEVERLRHHGTLLSNIAYNLAQNDRLSDAVRWSLDDERKKWDAAMRGSHV